MGSRSRIALTGTVLAVVLTASGCSDSTPQPSPTVTVTVTASPTPTPTAAPAPTGDPAPAPDPDAYDPALPGTWAIGFGGIGPLAVESTLPEVKALMPVAPETCRAGVDVYTVGGIGYTAVSGIDESDPSAPIAVVRMLESDGYDPSAPQPKTVEGIGLDSTVAELQSARPDVDTYQGQGGNTIYRILADGRTINFEDYGTGEIQAISVTDALTVGSEYCGA
jgi:hypothetical protein